jgi:hypothetical protein
MGTLWTYAKKKTFSCAFGAAVFMKKKNTLGFCYIIIEQVYGTEGRTGSYPNLTKFDV